MNCQRHSRTAPAMKAIKASSAFRFTWNGLLHWAKFHSRPAPTISTPATLIKLCFITEGGSTVDQAVLAELSRQNGISPPLERARHHHIAMGKGSLWWERHTEASTYLWEGAQSQGAQFSCPWPSVWRRVSGPWFAHFRCADRHYQMDKSAGRKSFRIF